MIKIAYCNVENLDLNKAYPLVSAKRKEISEYPYKVKSAYKSICTKYQQ